MAGKQITRRKGQKIVIGDNIVITIVESSTGESKIGIEAPPEVLIRKGEDSPAGPLDLTKEKRAG